MRVLIADDHDVVRQGLMYVLEKSYPLATFGEAAEVSELLRLVREQEWDVLILDINMPGRSGLEALKDLRHSHPRLPVLVLSSHPEDQYARRVLQAGAAGYMTKEKATQELPVALQRVLNGGTYVSRAVTEQLASPGANRVQETAAHERLSDREYQVLLQLATGKTVGQIAQDMGLSVPSVSTYRGRLVNKLHLKSTADIVRYAVEHGLSP